MKKIVALFCSILLISAIFTSCGEKKSEVNNSTENKPIIIGQTWVVDSIEPTVGGTPWSLTHHGLSETIFKLDRNGNLISRYVNEIKKIDNLTWEIILNKNIKFSDGSAINADAVVSCMNTIMNENPQSNATAGKVVFSKIDDLTIKAVTERETQNFKALLTEWTNILFKKTDNGYVFSGPFVIKDFKGGTYLDLVPNKFYPNADKRGEVIIKAFQDLSSMKLAFESGELDMAFGITPEIASELKEENKIVEPIDAGYQYFAILNLTSSILSDEKVREAVNIGLNRNDYLKALKGGRIPTGIFANYFSFAGNVKIDFNLDKAKALLEENGWKLNNKGIREKNGKKLTLNIITYNSRPDLKIIMQVMISQLKALGIETTTEIVEAIDKELVKKNFDIALYAQHTAPTGDPSYFLNQFFRTNGSKNYMGYSSTVVDSLLDKLGTLQFGSDSITITKEIQDVVYKDLPLLYLVDPEWNVALSERLKDYKPYSGDYYVVNEDLYK